MYAVQEKDTDWSARVVPLYKLHGDADTFPWEAWYKGELGNEMWLYTFRIGAKSQELVAWETKQRQAWH